MCDLVARTGRHQQRCESGCRLVAGCVPFRYKSLSDDCDMSGKIVDMLMINSTSGPGLLFPKLNPLRDFFICERVDGRMMKLLRELLSGKAMEEAGVRGDLKGIMTLRAKLIKTSFVPTVHVKLQCLHFLSRWNSKLGLNKMSGEGPG